jgi:hypothetical protein
MQNPSVRYSDTGGHRQPRLASDALYDNFGPDGQRIFYFEDIRPAPSTSKPSGPTGSWRPWHPLSRIYYLTIWNSRTSCVYNISLWKLSRVLCCIQVFNCRAYLSNHSVLWAWSVIEALGEVVVSKAWEDFELIVLKNSFLCQPASHIISCTWYGLQSPPRVAA